MAVRSASYTTERGPVAPSLNITPLIDVVFLIIIFFMLVSNLVGEEALPMVLPDLQDPETAELTDENRVVVNLAPEDDRTRSLAADNSHLRAPGFADVLSVGPRRFSPGATGDAEDYLRATVAARPNDPVLLRADGALYYEAVSPVLDAMTRAGVSDVKLVAYLPEDQR
ncbi:MAG: biopolymer transporter ExbD [Planctomycetota bacterium]